MTETEDTKRIVADIRARFPSDARIVFVSGNFNVVHPGHVRLLQFAAQCGDVLVVGVLDNGYRGATVPADMRLDGVRAISLVDHACLLRMPLEEFILALRPDVIVKGKEYGDLHNPESDLVASYGGKVLFGSGEVRFSSMDLIEREYRETNFSTIAKPMDFPLRHDFRVGALKEYLERFTSLRVTVIGDLIIDEYINCDPLGMSQEDPTIVVTPIERKKFVGGAGIVAAHARGLGAEVNFVTVAGDDDVARFACDSLGGQGINTVLFSDDSRPTTLKQRYRAAGKTLLRVSELRQHAINRDLSAQVEDAVAAHLSSSDLLIFSDFNYGCLPQPVVNRISALARVRGIPMVADSQASSQMSDISRFKGMELITPTEREARLALRDSDSGLAVVAGTLQEKAEAKNVVITLGAEGLLIWATDTGNGLPDRLPALNSAPKDPAGAGDSFLTCASMAMVAGANIWQASYLGALAAACQVSRVGNMPLSPDELIREIDWP
jgi:rfaE bifunctional protein kinase chain/domain